MQPLEKPDPPYSKDFFCLNMCLYKNMLLQQNNVLSTKI